MSERIRTIKPELFEDEQLGRMRRDVRLCFIALITMADDEGRFRAHPSLVRSRRFPYDLDLTDREVDGWLFELEAADRIERYEVEGQIYGRVVNFRKHQKINRPAPSRLPAPGYCAEFTEASVRPHGALTDGSGSGSVSGPGSGSSYCSELPADRPSELLQARLALGPGLSTDRQAEAQPRALDAILLHYPVSGTQAEKQWALRESKVAEYESAFPGIDVRAECRKALQWVLDNPGKRKTPKGMPRFLGLWLGRAQDSPRQGGRSRPDEVRPVLWDDLPKQARARCPTHDVEIFGDRCQACKWDEQDAANAAQKETT